MSDKLSRLKEKGGGETTIPDQPLHFTKLQARAQRSWGLLGVIPQRARLEPPDAQLALVTDWPQLCHVPKTRLRSTDDETKQLGALESHWVGFPLGSASSQLCDLGKAA